MPSFRFTIPSQPISVNHAYQVIRVKTKEGSQRRLGKIPGVENYQIVAATMARRALARFLTDEGPDFPLDQQVQVRYWIRSRRGVDASNVIKIAEDGIAAGLGINDKWFLPCVVENSKGHKEPHIEVEVAW